ncbi:MAG: FAD-binding oxidoreductase [Kiritimatiellaeota bacterium]|nr:FAD-binding oxidoreductase [Kiritimatiellota bacterium]
MLPLFIHAAVAQDYPDYLRDESRRTGRAEAIAFPASATEVQQALDLARQRNWPVTLQGGRTGITGGAVPEGGLILNLTRMQRVLGLRHDPDDDCFYIAVQPGLVLQELRRQLRARSFDVTGWSTAARSALARFQTAPPQFFPPDPTETTATLGGMVACNASGACTLRYGATRDYVAGLRLLTADGDTLELRRGRERAVRRQFALTTTAGRTLAGPLPAYTLPEVKNAAGYCAADDMDLIDLFIGSEGTLGVFTAIELQLLPEPAARWGLLAFFPDEAAALRFVRASRSAADVRPAALEFFDKRALNLLRREREHLAALAALPALPPAFHTAVYLEFHGAEDEVGAAVEATAVEIAASGGAAADVWLADTAHDLEKFKEFRHALPEAVNRLIDERRRRAPEVTKLGTDMAVPDAALEDVLARYHRDLAAAGLDYVIFGHIGNNHLHVNILPETPAQYRQGQELYLAWARDIVRLGGTVAAEHGIGKLKVPLLEVLLGAAGLAQLRAVKQIFDPASRLNRGNLFVPD